MALPLLLLPGLDGTGLLLDPVAKALPPDSEHVVVRGAGHFSFVTRFPGALKLLAGEAARDPAGFDRDTMHATMNPEIVSFFGRKLRGGASQGL